MTAALSNTLFAAVGQQGIVIISVCLSLVTLVLMVLSGSLTVREESREKIEDRLPVFIETYRLTPREADVLGHLLSDEDTNAEIAEKLGISVRVLQRYVASIYEKSGVQNRVGLVKLYYGH